MSNGALPPENTGIPPLNIPEQLILERVRTNPSSRTARILSAALRLSIEAISLEAPEASIGPDGIIQRFESKVDLRTLNDYRVILSKQQGCEVLAMLGVRRLEEKMNYLNRYFSRQVYKKLFEREVSSIQGRGNKKLLFTYGEIIYFYSEHLRHNIPEPLPSLPSSLLAYANEVDSYL